MPKTGFDAWWERRWAGDLPPMESLEGEALERYVRAVARDAWGAAQETADEALGLLQVVYEDLHEAVAHEDARLMAHLERLLGYEGGEAA